MNMTGQDCDGRGLAMMLDKARIERGLYYATTATVLKQTKNTFCL